MNVPLVFKRMLLLLISIATLTIVTSAFAQNVINIHPDHVGASNPGFQTGECPVDGWGWHYVLPGQSEFEDIHVRYQNAGWIHGGISDPTPKHMYQVTPGPDVILEAWAVINGDATRFNLSHVCTGSPLNPIKIIKFLDKNGNGVQDPGEPWLPDWSFDWQTSGGSNGTATTGSGGYVYATSQPIGVQFTATEQALPPGWENTTGMTQEITVVAGRNWVKFGNRPIPIVPMTGTLTCSGLVISNPNAVDGSATPNIDGNVLDDVVVPANSSITIPVPQDLLTHTVKFNWQVNEQTGTKDMGNVGPCETPVENSCESQDMIILEEGDGWIKVQFTINAQENQEADGLLVDFGDGSDPELIETAGPWTVEHTFFSNGISQKFQITTQVRQNGELLEGTCESTLTVSVDEQGCDWWFWIFLTWLDRDLTIHDDPFGHGLVVQSSNCHIENGTEQEGIPFVMELSAWDHDGKSDTLGIAMTRLRRSEGGAPLQMTLANNAFATYSHSGMGRYDKWVLSFQVVPTVEIPVEGFMMMASLRVKFTDPDGKYQEPYFDTKWLTVYPQGVNENSTSAKIPMYYWMNNTTTWLNGDSWEAAAGRCGLGDNVQAMLDLNKWFTIMPASGDEGKRWPVDGQVFACAWSGQTNIVVAQSTMPIAQFADQNGISVTNLIAINGLQGQFRQTVYAGQIVSLYVQEGERIQ